MQSFGKMMMGACTAITVLTACQNKDTNNESTMMPDSAANQLAMNERASAEIKDAKGRSLGTLSIEETPAGIEISGELKGLPPGERAFHLHGVGKCEAPFTSAGPHWNPTNAKHGAENPEGPHFGDMVNITVGTDSSVTINSTTPGGVFGGDLGLLDADGASVVIHAGPDDYKTDPAGNAGDRIACGVVTKK